MKRLSEELFFNYLSNSTRQGNSCVIFSIPNEYEPLPGDIVELFISEPNTYGGLTYYAKIVIYKGEDEIHTESVNGWLKGDDGAKYPLKTAAYYDRLGKKTIYLFADDNVNVLFNEEGNLVYMIVHRPKVEMELYVA